MAYKKLSRKGGLTIPQQMRHALGLMGGTAVQLVPMEDGALLIRPHCPACHECGSMVDVTGLRHVALCAVCFEVLKEAFDSDGE